MRITLIVAASENDVIGRRGDLPWRLPADLAHFKRFTMGKPIVMGRKTWGSIGRPLPGRLNIVLSRNPSHVADGCVVVDSLDGAIGVAAEQGAEELVVIGGAGVYAEAMERADTILLTRVHAVVEGDTYLPPMDPEAWRVVAVERHEADELNEHAFSFLELCRVA
jgi:dihydrofolate reductase